jgi:hypothetical protein
MPRCWRPMQRARQRRQRRRVLAPTRDPPQLRPRCCPTGLQRRGRAWWWGGVECGGGGGRRREPLCERGGSQVPL